MATITVGVAGFETLQRMAERFVTRFNEATITARAMAIATEAGVMLKEEVVAQLVKAVYSQQASEVLFSGSGLMDQGGFDTPDRSGDLHDAHTLTSEGLLQTVSVDMNHPVSDNAHSNRETVGDYALAVHEGYLQHIPLRNGGSMNTWTFHPGRPWFERAAIEGIDPLEMFVFQAFEAIVEELFAEVFS